MPLPDFPTMTTANAPLNINSAWADSSARTQQASTLADEINLPGKWKKRFLVFCKAKPECY